MKAVMDDLLTTREAAERLGVTDSRIRQMVMREQLPAVKKGRDLLIKASDLKLVEERPKGRPKQTAKVLMARKTLKQGGAKRGGGK
jgi:excisionase family DNA binding protein